MRLVCAAFVCGLAFMVAIAELLPERVDAAPVRLTDCLKRLLNRGQIKNGLNELAKAKQLFLA